MTEQKNDYSGYKKGSYQKEYEKKQAELVAKDQASYNQKSTLGKMHHTFKKAITPAVEKVETAVDALDAELDDLLSEGKKSMAEHVNGLILSLTIEIKELDEKYNKGQLSQDDIEPLFAAKLLLDELKEDRSNFRAMAKEGNVLSEVVLANNVAASFDDYLTPVLAKPGLFNRFLAAVNDFCDWLNATLFNEETESLVQNESIEKSSLFSGETDKSKNLIDAYTGTKHKIFEIQTKVAEAVSENTLGKSA